MNDDRAFERATREFLEDGSDRTSAATIDAVLLAVRTTPQERDLRIPWRTAPMSNLTAACRPGRDGLLVVGIVALNLRPASGTVGGKAPPTPVRTRHPWRRHRLRAIAERPADAL